jgi:hypothetical protein
LWWEDLRERVHLEDPAVDVRIILEKVFEKWGGKAWAGLVWFSIGRGGERF